MTRRITLPDGRSLSDAAVEAGLSYQLVWARWRRGEQLPELLRPARARRVEPSDRLPDGRSLYRAAVDSGLRVGTVQERWESGERDPERLLRPLDWRLVRLADGRTLREAAEDTGLPLTTLRWRWAHGWREPELLRPRRGSTAP